MAATNAVQTWANGRMHCDRGINGHGEQRSAHWRGVERSGTITSVRNSLCRLSLDVFLETGSVEVLLQRLYCRRTCSWSSPQHHKTNLSPHPTDTKSDFPPFFNFFSNAFFFKKKNCFQESELLLSKPQYRLDGVSK